MILSDFCRPIPEIYFLSLVRDEFAESFKTYDWSSVTDSALWLVDSAIFPLHWSTAFVSNLSRINTNRCNCWYSMTYYLFQRGIHMNQFTQTYDFTQYFQCKNKQYQKLIQMIAVIIQSNHSHYPYSHTLILEILLLIVYCI